MNCFINNKILRSYNKDTLNLIAYLNFNYINIYTNNSNNLIIPKYISNNYIINFNNLNYYDFYINKYKDNYYIRYNFSYIKLDNLKEIPYHIDHFKYNYKFEN